MKEEIEKLWGTIEELDKRVSNLEKILSSGSRKKISQEKISIKEFIVSKKPLDNIKLVLVLGYYFEKYENMNNFNIQDLKRGFESAKEKFPSNMNHFVNLNIKKNHIMAASQKKDKLTAWQLTNDGEKIVESIEGNN